MKTRTLISLLLFVGILTLSYMLPTAEARPFSQFKWNIDETYHRDGHVQFVVQKGSENFLPIGVMGKSDTTIVLHPTINHDQTGKPKLPLGVDIYFEPSVVTLADGEIKTVKLIVNVDENAPANLYDVQIVGTWKEEGKIPGFMGSAIRLHVGHDFGDGKIPVNMLDPPLKFWKLIKNEGGSVNDVPCRNDYVLVVKSSTQTPACVTAETKQKLIERKWIQISAVFPSHGISGEVKSFDDDTETKNQPHPGPRAVTPAEKLSHNVKNALTDAYYENVNLGPLKINDVIVGFGIENNELIIDVRYRYSTSSEMDIVKKKIRDIVGEEIKIKYIPFKTPPGLIEMAMQYHWNEYLHKNNIKFVPANDSYANEDIGIDNGDIMCSTLVAPNGTDFYIASPVDVSPFLIIDTFVTQEKPEVCNKTWKTDVLLEEPNRVISFWLAMGEGKIPN